MIRGLFLTAALAGSSLVLAAPAFAAGNNNSPPAGAILDLGGGETGTAAQTINTGAPVEESVTFTAGQTTTDITFAFREDPAYISFGQTSLVSTAAPSLNLLTNGDFSGGTYTSGGDVVPDAWNYDNIYGAAASGSITTCSAYGDANCWYDGSVQAYDAIDQVVATTIGQTYTLSFTYTDNSSLGTFSDLSTNGDTTGSGGNGVDILAYAQDGLPDACPPGSVCTSSVPEPAGPWLLVAGVAVIGTLRRRRNG